MNNGAYYTSTASYPGSSGWPVRMYFSWVLAGQNENGNYSVINWSIRADGAANNSRYTQYRNIHTWIDGGLVVNTGGPVNGYNTTYFGSGSYQLNHDGNGNRSFGSSAEAGIFYAAINSSGSGSWSLPSLYQAIGISSITFPTVTDVSFTIRVQTNRQANRLRLNVDGTGMVTYHSGNFTDVTVQVGSAAAPLTSGQNHTVVVEVRRTSNNNTATSGTQNISTAPQGKFFDVDDF